MDDTPARPNVRLTARLSALHDEYVWAVNDAVGHGQDDAVAELVDDYPDAALAVLAEELSTAPAPR